MKVWRERVQWIPSIIMQTQYCTSVFLLLLHHIGSTWCLEFVIRLLTEISQCNKSFFLSTHWKLKYHKKRQNHSQSDHTWYLKYTYLKWTNEITVWAELLSTLQQRTIKWVVLTLFRNYLRITSHWHAFRSHYRLLALDRKHNVQTTLRVLIDGLRV